MNRCSPVPFGYQRGEDGGLQPCPAELELLERRRGWRAGGATLPQIAGLLQYSERVRHPRTGRWFSARDVHFALTTSLVFMHR